MSFYKKYLIFSTILGLMMMIFSFHNEAVQEPAATEIQKELRVELNKIAPLPGATVVGTLDNHKSDHAFVENLYNSTLTMTQIYQYYNEQFVKNGWQFYKEKSVTDWGKDYGDKEFIYKKGDYEAVLDYTAPDPNLHQTFVVSISWGLYSD